MLDLFDLMVSGEIDSISADRDGALTVHAASGDVRRLRSAAEERAYVVAAHGVGPAALSLVTSHRTAARR